MSFSSTARESLPQELFVHNHKFVSHNWSCTSYELPLPAGRKVDIFLVAAWVAEDPKSDELPQVRDRPGTPPGYPDQQRVIRHQLARIISPLPVDPDHDRPEVEPAGEFCPEPRQLLVREEGLPLATAGIP